LIFLVYILLYSCLFAHPYLYEEEKGKKKEVGRGGVGEGEGKRGKKN
jgi:hypothetical protein